MSAARVSTAAAAIPLARSSRLIASGSCLHCIIRHCGRAPQQTNVSRGHLLRQLPPTGEESIYLVALAWTSFLTLRHVPRETVESHRSWPVTCSTAAYRATPVDWLLNRKSRLKWACDADFQTFVTFSLMIDRSRFDLLFSGMPWLSSGQEIDC